MNRLSRVVAIVPLMVAVCSLSAVAQQRPPAETSPPSSTENEALPGANRPGSDPLQLLLQSGEIQEKLELTDEQISQLKQVDQQVRSSLGKRTRGVNESAELATQTDQARKMVAEVLEPRQLSRLREILYQVNGQEAIDELSKPLGITSKQQEEIKEVRGMTDQKIRGDFTRARSSSPQEVCQTVNANRQKLESVRSANYQESLKQLSDEQREALEELQGEKITLQPPPCTSASSPTPASRSLTP